jgi:hypothetical protein
MKVFVFLLRFYLCAKSEKKCPPGEKSGSVKKEKLFESEKYDSLPSIYDELKLSKIAKSKSIFLSLFT